MMQIKNELTKYQVKMVKTGLSYSFLVALLFSVSGCATLTEEQAESKRNELDAMASTTVAELVEQNPEIQQQLDQAIGYAVGDMKLTKVPVVGAGGGEGVLFDLERDEVRYFKVKRGDLGGGWGARAFKALLIFPERDQFDTFKDGTWVYQAGAEASAGSASMDGAAGAGDYQMHVLSEGGASATVTARLIKVSIDKQLTEMAESETSYPTLHGDMQPDGMTSEEPRVWEHRLPFMAQDVIDLGFDLPLPYGFGITYANVRQDLILTDLEVGFNGGGLTPVSAVTFDNASAHNETIQLKADAWLFPFMNVYMVLGAIDGTAPLEFTIDGDDALAAQGIDCSSPPPPPQDPLCSLLGGKSITVPVEASYYGNNIGIGTVIAGGWEDYFIALPFTYVYSDINIIESRVETINFSPRVGKTFDFHDNGKLSVFLGATYLDVDMYLTGSVPIPGGEGTIDYKIYQANKDKWNALVGGNWDITKRWAWNFEIGFAGSRENIITAITRRY